MSGRPPAPLLRLLAVLSLTLGGAGCTVSFWHPDDGDAQVDAGPLPDGAPADAAVTPDAAAPPDAAPQDAGTTIPDGGCPDGTKECAESCVSLADPNWGCAAPGCDACSIPHATAQCVAGACAMGTCTGDWDNCDNDPSDGCEIDLANDVDNCGTCGYQCAGIPHAYVGCANTDCVFLSCQGDWRDCDNDIPSNGCETDTYDDNQNCGACGDVCPAGFNCNATACRCTSDTDCNTGGGGTCDSFDSLCHCPIVWCSGPCHPSGSGCL